MSRPDTAVAFARLLVGQEPFFDHEVDRPQGRLRVRGYVAAVPVPEAIVSGVRAVVFKGSRVVVLTESDGTRHVMPGGRRKPGEGLDATLRRELLEECGWHVGELTPFAFLHFQHPGPERPADWSDFVNLIYLCDAVRYDGQARDPSQGKVRSRLTSTRAAYNVVTDRHRAILAAASSARRAALT